MNPDVGAGKMIKTALFIFMISIAVCGAARAADDGKVIAFYENGQLKSEMTYQNGILHGPYAMYFENGKPMMRGAMKNGKRHGRWEVFYFNGDKSLHSSGVYQNGTWVRR